MSAGKRVLLTKTMPWAYVAKGWTPGTLIIRIQSAQILVVAKRRRCSVMAGNTVSLDEGALSFSWDGADVL
jgi:hypothetical protein